MLRPVDINCTGDGVTGDAGSLGLGPEPRTGPLVLVTTADVESVYVGAARTTDRIMTTTGTDRDDATFAILMLGLSAIILGAILREAGDDAD